MIGYFYNDGGRERAGYEGSALDCVCRAVAILTGRPYEQVYRTLASANASVGLKNTAREGVYRFVWAPVLRRMGLAEVKLGRGVRPTYTEAHDRYGNCIATTRRHICTLADGYLHDTFDGRLYEWVNEYGLVELRERKAQGVWVPRTHRTADLKEIKVPRRRRAKRPGKPVFR